MYDTSVPAQRATYDGDTKAYDLKTSEYSKEFKNYCGHERVLLRRLRTKLRVDKFHIIAQVGQGGHGEIFLARKQETGEAWALKKKKKKTLFKMDEVCSSPLADHMKVNRIDPTMLRST
ncbi:hypothetical protein EDD85DRAFT_971246 [Armillaria nabsnona]|nr:hypothetical protein EDD85DRAFT_971246 [Armillaria nabsnona]